MKCSPTTLVATFVLSFAFVTASNASISFTAVGDLSGGGTNSVALGVSGDGSTVVGYSGSSSGTEAFRWTAGGGMTGLGDLPGGASSSVATGVSGDGSTIVGYSGSSLGTEAFRWTAGGSMMGLGDLPGGGTYSVAWGVSGDGSTVVGRSDSGSNNNAFIWDATHGMRSLHGVLTLGGIDLTGWQLFEARGISADGRYIVGYGVNPNGSAEAWLVDLGLTVASVPEPLSFVVWSCLIAAVVVLQPSCR